MAAPLNRRLREGIAAAQAREFDRARQLLEEIVAEAPGELLAWFWLAVASPSADEAIRCLRRVLESEANHAPARQALAKLLASQAATTAAAGDRASARQLALEASELEPESSAVWLALAAASDGDDRIDALRQATAVNGDDVQLRNRLRQALLHRGNTVARADRDHARRLFREAAGIDPRDVRVWRALSRLADTAADAVAPLRELVSIDPNDAAARSALKAALVADAQALGERGAGADAAARWREVVAFDERDIAGWLGLADATEDDQESEQALDRAAAIGPSDERVIAAIARQRAPLDLSAVPLDAFERLAAPADALESLHFDDDGFAQFDMPPEAAAAPAEADPRVDVRVEPPRVDTPAVEAVPARPTLAVASPEPGPAIVPPADAANDAAQRTIMVVDDSPTIRKILGLTLERAGYKVVAEPDGESAVERLNHVVPNLILLDIAMPKLDGYEVCKRIKQDPRTSRVPVVMLSGKDAFFDKVKGKMAGATEYLTKPFETPAVLAVVSAQCQAAEGVTHG